jgi:hypothetical protein
MNFDNNDAHEHRRTDPRSEIAISEIKGIATRLHDLEQGPFIIWDISDNGLRLWSAVKMKRADIVRLTIAKPFVLILNAEVRWIKEEENETGFLIGLKVLDNLQRLSALHKSATEAGGLDIQVQSA